MIYVKFNNFKNSFKQNANNDNIKELVENRRIDYLNYIDTTNVTNMRYLFIHSDFNGDISRWNVSNVTDMDNMFSNSIFDGDISMWDVSRVTDMYGMFSTPNNIEVFCDEESYIIGLLS